MKIRLIAGVIAVTLVVSLFSGCKKEKAKDVDSVKDQKVTISIGNWAQDNKPAQVEMYKVYLKKFNEKYPNIEVVPDKWLFDINSFLPKAASNQLPTLYNTFFTETKKIISAGYAADLTAPMEKYEYTKGLKHEIIELVSQNGKTYGVPFEAYALGLFINLNLFKEAGELKEDGTPNYPNSFDELAQLAKRIKEKTGKAGLVLPTINNCGGWHFTNIAWSFGTEFMKQENGKWIATFNSNECISALQYVKDLKWKYNLLPENAFIDIPEMQKLFATDQAAMYFAAPTETSLIQIYKMDRNDIAIGTLPGGPGGRYALMGGGVKMINPNATPEQIDACFKWLEVIAAGPNIDEDKINSIEKNLSVGKEQGLIIGIQPYQIWKNIPRVNTEGQLRAKYANVDTRFFKEYEKFEGVRIRSEEPVNSQELYKILDACVQAVLTDKNADPKTIIEAASKDFQKNYLDRVQ